jgi:hypothetical protein
MARLIKKHLLGALLLIAVSEPAMAVVHFTLGGSQSQNNVGQSYLARAGSASVAMDLGEYFRIGITHRQEFSVNEGYVEYRTQKGQYYLSPGTTHVVANSVDLTIILYNGDTLVPFIQGGLVRKDYDFEVTKEDDDGQIITETGTATQGPVPSLGAGVGIKLNRSFTLKLSYVASPGYVTMPDGELAGKLDTYTQVGITYQIQ